MINYSLFYRPVVIGILILLIGMCIIPSNVGDCLKKSSIPPYKGYTLYVGGSGPDNYTSIRNAIEDATSGTTIFVYDDSAPYYENYLIIDKPLQIIGENKNTTIIDSVKGLTIFNVFADSVTISGFNIINSSGYGIYLEKSSYCTIYENIISNHGHSGIRLSDHSNYNMVNNNTIIDCIQGILILWYSNFNNINHNIVNENQYGITIGGENSDNNYVTNNRGYGNGYGIHIYQDADYNTLIDNYFEASSHHPFYGVMIQASSSYNTLKQNTFVKYNHAADVRGSSNNNIFLNNNFLSSRIDDARDICSNIWSLGYNNGGNHYSMYTGADTDEDGIGDTPHTILGGSNVDEYPLRNPYGSINNIDTKSIYRTIQYAIDASSTLEGHTIQLKTHTYYEHVDITKSIKLTGVQPTDVIIDGSRNNTPITIQTDNVQLKNLQIQRSGIESSDSGIHIISNNNIICQNTIINCENGINISLANDNKIYHNNFIRNIQHAWDDGDNTWDDGYPSGGNYWDDYTGIDENGDGIGDISYVIPGGSNEDQFPFINKNGWSNHAPSPPAIKGPTLCAVDRSYDYSFVSIDEDNDDVSYYIFWGDNTSTGWTPFYPSGKTEVFNHTWHKIGTYYIEAKAKDILDVHSNWTEPYTVIIVENGPPNKPTITGPKKGAAGRTYNFTIQSTDPNDHDIYYWIDWGDNTNTGWIGPVTSNMAINVNHSWEKQDIYKITAKAKDILLEESGWTQHIVNIPRHVKQRATKYLFLNYMQKLVQLYFYNTLFGLHKIMNKHIEFFSMGITK